MLKRWLQLASYLDGSPRLYVASPCHWLRDLREAAKRHPHSRAAPKSKMEMLLLRRSWNCFFFHFWPFSFAFLQEEISVTKWTWNFGVATCYDSDSVWISFKTEMCKQIPGQPNSKILKGTRAIYQLSFLLNQNKNKSFFSIAYSDQNFCDWDLKLLQATQHQGSHDRQFSGLPVVAALSR